jgi:hypothetical protein
LSAHHLLHPSSHCHSPSEPHQHCQSHRQLIIFFIPTATPRTAERGIQERKTERKGKGKTENTGASSFQKKKQRKTRRKKTQR